MDRIKPKWTEWTEYDQCGPNMTEVNRIGPIWTDWTQQEKRRPHKSKVDQRGQNRPNRTEVGRIGLLNIYHFYDSYF